MNSLYIKYNREKFWEDYWKIFEVDPEEFVDLNMYPIDITLKYVKKNHKILECGFGGGRIIRHLHKNGYDIEGIEYDKRIVYKLKKIDGSLKIHEGDILKLNFKDNLFDVSLCFGVICGLYDKTAKAIFELKRVTKNNGIILISVMLDNVARKIMRIINFFSKEKLNFYAWMDTKDNWINYFNSFGLDTIEYKEVVSRYSIYYWNKFLRKNIDSNLTLARVNEKEYKLNFLGELFWQIHKSILRNQLAMGITFVLRNKD